MEKAERMKVDLDEIHRKIAENDKEIIQLEEQLRLVPGDHEESRHGDDNATEAAGAEQSYGIIRERLKHLREENAQLRDQLERAA